jgi:threonine synthase
MLSVSCTSCHTRFDDDGTYYALCPACGGVLDVDVTAERLRAVDPAVLRTAAPEGIDHYRDLLPLGGPFPWPSLGEGNTPLVHAERLAEAFGIDDLWLKNEGQNPTGSFKDRPIAVAVAKAIECGARALVTSSSGNAGASLAAYAARAGVPAWVLVPERTPSQNVGQIALHGARVVKVRGDVGEVFNLGLEIARAFAWTNVSTTFLSPFPTEGNKTVAYELARQRAWTSPEWILVPVGAGPLPYGILKGFRELHELGMVASLPRMVAVQAEGCAPIVRAYQQRRPVEAWGAPQTVAKGIADPLRGYEHDGELVIDMVRRSGGTAIAVDDDEIMSAARLLARAEGVLAEPTGAVAVAGAKALQRRGLVRPGDHVVAVVTGSGLKHVEGLSADAADPPTIDPTLERFVAAVEA